MESLDARHLSVAVGLPRSACTIVSIVSVFMTIYDTNQDFYQNISSNSTEGNRMAHGSEHESERTIMLFTFSVLTNVFFSDDPCAISRPELLKISINECKKTVGAIRGNFLDLNSALSNLSIHVKKSKVITFQESADGLIVPEVNCAKMQYRDTRKAKTEPKPRLGATTDSPSNK